MNCRPVSLTCSAPRLPCSAAKMSAVLHKLSNDFERETSRAVQEQGENTAAEYQRRFDGMVHDHKQDGPPRRWGQFFEGTGKR